MVFSEFDRQAISRADCLLFITAMWLRNLTLCVPPSEAGFVREFAINGIVKELYYMGYLRRSPQRLQIKKRATFHSQMADVGQTPQTPDPRLSPLLTLTGLTGQILKDSILFLIEFVVCYDFLCFFHGFQCFSMLFPYFFHALPCFLILFRCFSICFQCFSWLFNCFSMLLSCFFNAFQ